MEDLCIGSDKTNTFRDSIWIGKPEAPQITGESDLFCYYNYDFHVSENSREAAEWYTWSTNSILSIIDSCSFDCTIAAINGGWGMIKVRSYNCNGYTEDTFWVNVTCPHMLVYPNPANESVNIDITDDSSPGIIYDVSLYDSKGKRWRFEKSKNKIITWDIADLEEGYYVVKLSAYLRAGNELTNKSVQFLVSR